MMAISDINTLLVCSIAVGVYVLAQWISSVWLRDASIVDRFWGGGFVLIAAVALLHTGASDVRPWIVMVMVAIWGLRLSAYLTWRNWGGGEDYRYQAMRKRHGDAFWWKSLYIVFGLQGFLTWFIGLPLMLTMISANSSPLSWIDDAGIALWAIGLAFESVGDWQLARFKANPENKGRVMDRGLWRYTRHPNYFGDALLWWGMFIVTLSATGAYWTVICPIAMTFLLMRVSGVPLLERRLNKTRPEYADYAARTSAFFPWPPAQSTAESTQVNE